MRLAEEGVRRGIGSAEGAQGVLAHAARHARDVDGSSTAVVLVMRSRGGGAGDAAAAGAEIVAEVACVGDSGFRLHRGGRLVFASDVRASMALFCLPLLARLPALFDGLPHPRQHPCREVHQVLSPVFYLRPARCSGRPDEMQSMAGSMRTWWVMHGKDKAGLALGWRTKHACGLAC